MDNTNTPPIQEIPTTQPQNSTQNQDPTPSQTPQPKQPSWLLLGIGATIAFGMFTTIILNVTKDTKSIINKVNEVTNKNPEATEKSNEEKYGRKCKFDVVKEGEYESYTLYYEYEDTCLAKVEITEGNELLESYNVLSTKTHNYTWLTSTKDEETAEQSAAKLTKEETVLMTGETAEFRDQFMDEINNNPGLCETWKVEPDILTPPSDIDFKTMQDIETEMETGVEETIDKVEQSACKTCIEAYETFEEQVDCFVRIIQSWKLPLVEELGAEKAFTTTCQEML
jgi:hypothetical protein